MKQSQIMEEDKNDPKGGIMNWWYGNPKANKRGGDLAKSDLIEEELKEEDHVGSKVNRYSKQGQLKASNKRGLS